MSYQIIKMTYGSRKKPVELHLDEEQVVLVDEGFSEDPFIIGKSEFNDVFSVSSRLLIANLEGKIRNYNIDKEGHEALKEFTPPLTYQNLCVVLRRAMKTNIFMGLICIFLAYFCVEPLNPGLYGFDLVRLLPAVLLLASGLLARYRPTAFCFVLDGLFWLSFLLFNAIGCYTESGKISAMVFVSVIPLFFMYVSLTQYLRYRHVKRPNDWEY